MKDLIQATTFHRSQNCLTGNLLPPRASLVITHNEVLIINARKVKCQFLIVYLRLPHQTGVAERSVSGDDWQPSDNVIDNVMIRQLANRVCHGFAIHFYRQNFVAAFNKTCFADICIRNIIDRMEHPLKMILPCEPRADDGQ